MNKTAAPLVVLALAGSIIGFALARPFNEQDSRAELTSDTVIGTASLEELSAASHVILIAKRVAATPETVDVAPPATPEVGTRLTVVKYELQVAEVLKGQPEAYAGGFPAFVVVGSDPYGAPVGLPEWKVEPPLLKPDREYVIYLQFRDG